MDSKSDRIKRYTDCTKSDGDCDSCSLNNYSRDCRNNPVNKLAYYRTLRGYSQRELAEKAGVHKNQIQNVEYGKRNFGGISVRIALKIADALEIDVRNLI